MYGILNVGVVPKDRRTAMASTVVDLPHTLIEAKLDEWRHKPSSQLDAIYKTKWQNYKNLYDEYSDEGDDCLAAIVAIESIRGYKRGQVNKIRHGL